MTHSTLDISSINSPDTGIDLTEQWEDECDLRSLPKLKYPVKLTDDSISGLDLNFTEPNIPEPQPKKRKNEQLIRIVDLGKKTKNEKKKKLF